MKKRLIKKIRRYPIRMSYCSLFEQMHLVLVVSLHQSMRSLLWLLLSSVLLYSANLSNASDLFFLCIKIAMPLDITLNKNGYGYYKSDDVCEYDDGY